MPQETPTDDISKQISTPNGWGHLIISVVVLIGGFYLLASNPSPTLEDFVYAMIGLVLLGWFGASIAKSSRTPR